MGTRATWAAGGALLGGAISVAVAVTATDRDPGDAPTILITAVLALGVAVITAVTTDRRQDRQLAHERAVLTDQLKAERERQAASIAHERIMHDLAEIRGIVDDAHKAAYALTAPVYFQVIGQIKDGAQNADAVDDWTAIASEAFSQHGRLAGRLGIDHAVTKSYRITTQPMIQSVHDAIRLARAGGSDDAIALAEDARVAYAKHLMDFTAAAREFVGSAQEVVNGPS